MSIQSSAFLLFFQSSCLSSGGTAGRGKEKKGKERKEKERREKERNGKERNGKERNGKEKKGKGREEKETKEEERKPTMSLLQTICPGNTISVVSFWQMSSLALVSCTSQR